MRTTKRQTTKASRALPPPRPTQSLQDVLEATGFLTNGAPAGGVLLGNDAQRQCRGSILRPDAVWTGKSRLTVYFKDASHEPLREQIAQWQRATWNHGFAPLLWVISPSRIDLYNGFSRPVDDANAEAHLLDSFQRIESELDRLDAAAGRLAMETGKFWTQPMAVPVDRHNGVDHQLLHDLAQLEDDLLRAGLGRLDAQALIGRAIFTQYLLDRSIVSAPQLREVSGHDTLAATLRDAAATSRLFDRLKGVFNGDMFPQDSSTPAACHLARVADFLEATDPHTGQTTLFPYQFDVIPVDVISSIYEQFAQAVPTSSANQPSLEDTAPVQRDVFYTPTQLVSLVLDEVTDGLSGEETVLDMTCGSAVFLVEALRRLAHLRAGGGSPTGALVRQVLREQIYGVDISEAAVRVAAFSLYLAALELDPNPTPLSDLAFEPLMGRNLIVGDAWDDHDALMTEGERRNFDVIVGNPPWSDPGRGERALRRQRRGPESVRETHGDSINFAFRALDFASADTRIGLILSGNPFFSQSEGTTTPAQQLVAELAPLTLVNLANLRDWLFAKTKLPAVALFARHRTYAPSTAINAVQVPWSPSGIKTTTIEVSPSDVIAIPRQEWERSPQVLKTAFLGGRRDMALLIRLAEQHGDLKSALDNVGTALRAGLGGAGGNGPGATHLRGKPFLDNAAWMTAQGGDGERRLFSTPDNLNAFQSLTATRPRRLEVYNAPLVLVKEYFSLDPRPVVLLADEDLVYSDAFHGVSFANGHREAGDILAAVLCSALAAWFLLNTSSSFGTWMQRIKIRDLEIMPCPDLLTAPNSGPGNHLRQLVRRLRGRTASDADNRALDEAVFDLYGLGEAERVVVRDGLFRARWQWEDGREASAAAVSTQHLLEYAGVFLGAVDRWLATGQRRHMRAEVFDLSDAAPLRLVRFVLEDGATPSPAPAVVRLQDSLRVVLNRIGNRLRVPIGARLYGQRELRVHGRSEVVVIKPNARRHWLGVRALEDADAVMVDSWAGQSA